MDYPSVLDHLGPFRTDMSPFGPFQTKMNFLLQMDKVGFGGGASEQKNQCLFEMVLRGPDGPKRVPNGQNTLVDHFGLFWTLPYHLGTLTSLPCLAIFVRNGPFFGPSPVVNGGSQSKKKGLLCVACF